MKAKLVWAAAVVAGAVALPAIAAGQTIQERLARVEEKIEEQRQGLAGALGIDVHGFVAGNYLYNINNPDSHGNGLRVFDTDANSFTLDQANLSFARSKEDESLGFGANLDFGKTAEVVGSVTRWSNNPDNTESRNSFELRDAYVTYKVPVGDGVTLKAGKFVTLHGAEVIKNYDSFNYSVSQSILFGFAIPFTHTGVMASFPLGEYVTGDVGVVNGWDNVVDNNDGKSLHAGVNIAPTDQFSLYLSGTYGPEQDDNGKSKRAMATALATLEATDRLTFIVDANYGDESDFDGRGEPSAHWFGVAAYAICQLNDQWSVSLRGEVFDDADGARTLAGRPDEGGIDTGFAPGLTAWEVTPSVSYQITDGLLWRTEYRHDEADKRFFEKNGGFQRGQDTVATQLIYAF